MQGIADLFQDTFPDHAQPGDQKFNSLEKVNGKGAEFMKAWANKE